MNKAINGLLPAIISIHQVNVSSRVNNKRIMPAENKCRDQAGQRSYNESEK